eukprot:scaffold14142_cov94-Isochrysis_galbana.AAC.2
MDGHLHTLHPAVFWGCPCHSVMCSRALAWVRPRPAFHLLAERLCTCVSACAAFNFLNLNSLQHGGLRS